MAAPLLMIRVVRAGVKPLEMLAVVKVEIRRAIAIFNGSAEELVGLIEA